MADYIYLTGSKETIRRVVKEIGGKHFVKFYGQYIEVERGRGNWRTVEAY